MARLAPGVAAGGRTAPEANLSQRRCAAFVGAS